MPNLSVRYHFFLGTVLLTIYYHRQYTQPSSFS